MATNRQLRTALLKKMGITAQALSKRVQKKKAASPMSTEDATYLIAHEVGIKIDKYLDDAQVDRVRQLHGAFPRVSHADTRPTRTKPRDNENREIRFPGEFRITNPLLPAAKLAEARDMARIYPLLYVLENSMRELILRVMTSKCGEDWWTTQLNSGNLKTVREKADTRINAEDSRLRWHQTRGGHPLDYVDLKDLGAIILGRHAHFFPDILGDDQDWFKQFMKELEPSRNVVCHMNPLDRHNIEDVRLKAKKWERLLMNAKGRMPGP